MTYRLRGLSLLLLSATILTSCSPQAPKTETTMTKRTYDASPGILADEQIQDTTATLHTTRGKIEVALLPDEAPRAVSNFVFLARDGFYDGLTFHRVEPGFVVQGGDPNGDGTGGPGYTFADEPVTRPYQRGIVAMANRGPDTNGSQFFIVLEDTELPPHYTIFGQVTQGMEVVDQIERGDTMETVTISHSEPRDAS